jgi:hypothetical protein
MCFTTSKKVKSLNDISDDTAPTVRVKLQSVIHSTCSNTTIKEYKTHQHRAATPTPAQHCEIVCPKAVRKYPIEHLLMGDL